MTMDRTTAIAAADQNYALAKELLMGCPVNDARERLAADGDETKAFVAISAALLALADEQGIEEALPYITDQLAAAAIQLAKNAPRPAPGASNHA